MAKVLDLTQNICDICNDSIICYSHRATPTSLDYVVFGDTFQGAGDEASENRQVAYVDRAYPFPGANFFTFEGDVMLLKFVEPLTITDYVRPICLPSEDANEVTDYDVCYTTGWGLNEDYEFNSYLQEEKATLLDYYNCSSRIKDLDENFLASENMICASYDEDLVGPCLGDGGNPIACYGNGTWDVVGIISWGYGCGDANSPSISWRTTAYLDFINDVISHTYDAELCEPVEEGLCNEYLPYNATYRGTQQTAEYTISRLFEIGSQSPYCNTSDLMTTLCAASHGDCYPGEEGQKVLCRGYCEAVIGYCNLTDAVYICTDLPYGDYEQKWCVKASFLLAFKFGRTYPHTRLTRAISLQTGADYSCGYYNRTLTLEEPLLHLGSPFAPYQFPELRRCFWLLSAPEGYVIQLKYNYLDIYPDTDYISYGEGDPYSYTSTLARFDGYVPPAIWTSSYNSMWIKFQSNFGPGSSYGFGLYAFITPEEGRDCLDTDIFCDDTCYDYGIACDFIYDCYDGTDEADCGDLEVGEEGLNITSPFYPIPLEYRRVRRRRLYIAEGSDGDIEDALYVFTGYRSSFRILPFADSIWMTLVSDGYDFGGKGFGAFAYLVNDTAAAELECDEDYEFDCGDRVCLSFYVTCDGTEQCQDGSDEEGCARDACNNGTYLPPYETCNQEWFCKEGEDEEDCPPLENGESFYLSPPSDPYNYDRYANNISISWTAKAGEGSGFAVEFVTFSTEPRFDRLYIGSPSSSSLDDLYYFDGYGAQKPFIHENNEFYASFVSDENKNEGSVYLLVTVVDLEESVTCDKGTLLHPNQVCNGLWECLDGRDEYECEPLDRYATAAIATPYFPESYENNADLLWTFTAEDDLQILFVPQIFYTEEDYDVLRIGSGTDCREAYFEELSGVLGNGAAFISQDNTLCLHFSSDYAYTDVGFYGFVQVVNEEDYVVCPEDDTIVAQSYICNREWNCGQTGLDEVDCERFQQGDTVYVNSPYYPDVYPANTTWIWSGSGEEGLGAYIEFYEFDVEEYVDFLYIGCGFEPSDEDSIRAVLTGSEIPDPILLNCSDVWLRFESDGEGQNYGYSGLLTVVDPVDECTIPPEIYPENACASIKLCEVEGEFVCVPLSYEPFPVVTTNYPYLYDDNTTATALLIAPDGYRIFLNISDFALEDGFDFLRVGFEPDPTSEDYASVLTGNDLDLPYTTVTPGRTLSLKFTSDGGVADIGFYGQAYIIPEEAVLFCDGYEVEPENICNYIWDCSDGSDEAYCDPVPAGGSGITASPGYPEEDYPNNATIVWSFTGEPATRFTVNVIDLETEENYDFLNIGYGRDPYDASTLLASFSGSEIPEEAVVTPGNLLWVSLVTDEAFNFRGFYLNISLQASERGCNVSEDLPAQSVCGALLFCKINQTLECNDVSEEPQSVSSPNFPDVYDDLSEIRSVFVAPDGYRLVLNITEFALEAGFDFLYVGNEVDPTSTDFERSLTGDSLDLPYVFMSEGNTLVTLFASDDSIGDSGYYGNVYAISEEEFFVCDGETIDPEDLCNYEWHCRDGSDEEDCGSLIAVNVFDLALEDGFDFLRFGSGRDPNNTATELAALTGSELPDEQFVTRGNELWVTFVTDGAFNERGFFINLTIVAGKHVTPSNRKVDT
ncbi:hypothetical protein BSL78_14846 [Apostichopus japonicus]|uniref:CUB domain-containing protein n=1 Tax=Stichopus japonicus TaxID=307972 RepID=A0A2G8KK05_STIJA|nr:hypothetical protein BSL78_14846 [Apostichopus japonicus]